VRRADHRARRSRWAVATSGVILIVLGLFPKLATVVASIPSAVLGGAGIAMFGMVAATGIKILANARLSERQNLLVVAVSIGIGMVPLVSPTMLAQLPSWTAPFAHSGITLAAFTAVVLNALFNGSGDAIPEQPPRAVVATVSGEIPEPSRV
jgi:xanthine/uracil permease